MILTHYERLLEPAELDLARRLRLAADRRQHLITRALVRHVLSLYAPQVAPADWRFASNRHGKPAVAAPLPDLVHFNLSHTSGLVVMAVSRRRPVGVDCELHHRPAPLRVAERFFSAHERRWLSASPAALRATRFFELWTLKEAYVKALGLGLTMPLSSFEVRLTARDGIDVTTDQDATAQAPRCALWLLDAGRHRVAVAADGAGPLHLTTRKITPGSHHELASWPTLRRTRPQHPFAEPHQESTQLP